MFLFVYCILSLRLVFFSVFIKVFKNLEIFFVYFILKRIKVFTLESARTVVVTLYLL
jgi:hypothetical protein